MNLSIQSISNQSISHLMFICSYSAQQVVGLPNVFTYGDNKMAWKQGPGRGVREEYLHVSSTGTRYRVNCGFSNMRKIKTTIWLKKPKYMYPLLFESSEEIRKFGIFSSAKTCICPLEGLTNVCFPLWIVKKLWPLLPLSGWYIFDLVFATAERNTTTLDRKQDLNVFYQICVLRADRKTKMATLTSDWLRQVFNVSLKSLNRI